MNCDNWLEPKNSLTAADIAFAFQEAVADTLSIKCRRALQQHGSKKLVVSGGVSANNTIRHTLTTMVERENARIYFTRLEFCTDNGAMIAYAGCQRYLAGQRENLEIQVKARWPIDQLS